MIINDLSLRRLFGELRWRSVRRNPSAWVECRCTGGLRLEVPVRDYMGSRLIRKGYYDPVLTGLMRRVVRPGDVCVDVGANLGYFTSLLVKLVGETGRVYAFEPDPDLFLRLQSNLERNRGAGRTENVVIKNLALSDHDGEAQFLQAPSGNIGLGQVVDDAQPTTPRRSFKVKLSTVAEQLGAKSVRLVKIDVEGHELPVLRGMLQGTHPVRPDFIFCEAHRENRSAIKSFLETNDYETTAYAAQTLRLAQISPSDLLGAEPSIIGFRRGAQAPSLKLLGCL